MIELAVASKKDLLFPADSSDGKPIKNIDNSKDFTAVLEKTKKVQSDLNSKDNSCYGLRKLSTKNSKTEEDSPKDKDKYIFAENTINKLIDMLNSTYQMILFLNKNPDGINAHDMETLKLKLKELSSLYDHLISMEKLDFSGKVDNEILGEFISLLNSEKDELKFIGNNELMELKEILNKLDSFKENSEEDIAEEIKAKSQEYIKGNLQVFMNKSLENNKSNEEIPKKVLNEGESEPKNKERMLGKETVNRTVNSEKTENNYETKDNSQEYQMNSNFPTFELFGSLREIPNLDAHIENLQQIDKEDIVQQIVDKIKLSLSNDKQEIKLKLKPDILGELLLKMELKDGTLTAKLIVDNYKTKELIETNLIQLKEQIKDNGLEIRTFEVFVGTNEDFEKNERERFYSSKSSARLKIKGNAFRELQSYDDSYDKVKPTPYYDGKLNLFA